MWNNVSKLRENSNGDITLALMYPNLLKTRNVHRARTIRIVCNLAYIENIYKTSLSQY